MSVCIIHYSGRELEMGISTFFRKYVGWVCLLLSVNVNSRDAISVDELCIFHLTKKKKKKCIDT